jgi:2,4-dichlorophenol 6-monooxygenase
MRTIETDVLVVGAGPAGLAASALLARHEVAAITISRYSGTAPTPRAHITNQRTMEIMRDLGIEGDVRAAAMPDRDMGDNIWAISIAGRELARAKAWGAGVDRKGDYEASSPCRMCNIGQHELEPILLEAALDRGAQVWFSHELTSIVERGGAVWATVLDRSSGEEYQVRAKYAIGADGGRSTVVSQLGFEMEGESGLGHAVNIWFEADLARYREHRPGALFYTIKPSKDFWLGSGTFVTVRPWNEFVLIVVYDPSVQDFDLSEEAVLARVREEVGDPDVEIKVKDVSQWQLNHLVASTYRKGRVFIAGDAAHRHPPANGLGSNTSIQDSYNLAWKLSLVLRGLAGEELLETYDQERQPVGRQVVNRAMASAGLFGQFPGVFGVSNDQTEAEGYAALEGFFSDTEDGRARRAKFQEVAEQNNHHFNANGVELGQRYSSTAVVTDGQVPPTYERDPELYYHRTTFPGAYLPHAWVVHHGKTISTLDLAGDGEFTLLTGIGGEAWGIAAQKVAKEFGIPLRLHSVGRGQEYDDAWGDWARLREVGDHGAVLVRPDRYIAWRSADMVDDPSASLRRALGTVLAR